MLLIKDIKPLSYDSLQLGFSVAWRCRGLFSQIESTKCFPLESRNERQTTSYVTPQYVNDITSTQDLNRLADRSQQLQLCKF